MNEVTTTQYSYSVVHRGEKWGVMVEDDQGTPPWLLTWKATEDEFIGNCTILANNKIIAPDNAAFNGGQMVLGNRSKRG